MYVSIIKAQEATTRKSSINQYELMLTQECKQIKIFWILNLPIELNNKKIIIIKWLRNY